MSRKMNHLNETMSLYEQIMKAQADAQVEAQQIRQLRYRKEHCLTDQDRVVLKDIYDIACHPKHRPSILNAASGYDESGRVQNSYVLYRGSELECLDHLKYDIRNNIIRGLCRDIRQHYGDEFTILYSDATYDGLHAPIGRDAELRLKWPEVPK